MNHKTVNEYRVRMPVIASSLRLSPMVIASLLSMSVTGFAEPSFNNMKIEGQMNSSVEWFALLSVLSILPLLVVSLTTFTRNIVVLSLLRQALGLQQTPPNMVMIALAFFLSAFTMTPTLTQSFHDGVEPYMEKQLGASDAIQKAWYPIRDFMVRQTRESDLIMVHGLAKEKIPERAEDLKPVYLIPAFMLGELKMAFQIGFIIFLPFLLIDLVVASILMSLGMIMVPPVTISLPMKILLFIIIDGWNLVAQTLVNSVTQ